MMHPGRLNRFGLIARTVALSQQMRIGYRTPAEERRNTFAGKCEMTKEQLEYMLLCAKETRARKTW